MRFGQSHRAEKVVGIAYCDSNEIFDGVKILHPPSYYVGEIDSLLRLAIARNDTVQLHGSLGIALHRIAAMEGRS